MPRFEITGADRDTGFVQTLRLDAKNEHEARAMAVMKLLSIAKVQCMESDEKDTESHGDASPQSDHGKTEVPSSHPQTIPHKIPGQSAMPEPNPRLVMVDHRGLHETDSVFAAVASSIALDSTPQTAANGTSIPPAMPKRKYEEILTGAKVLRTLAGICDVVGSLVIVTGVIGGSVAISNQQVLSAFTVFFCGALVGFFYFALGAILAMLAGLGHAVRDIAIMSLREK